MKMQDLNWFYVIGFAVLIIAIQMYLTRIAHRIDERFRQNDRIIELLENIESKLSENK
jgi:hypothetical protein